MYPPGFTFVSDAACLSASGEPFSARLTSLQEQNKSPVGKTLTRISDAVGEKPATAPDILVA